jgi:hypothetical protein
MTDDEKIRGYLRDHKARKAVAEGGMNYLLDFWEGAVDQLAADHPTTFLVRCFDDYLWTMDQRHLVHQLISLCDDPSRAIDLARLFAIDEKFKRVTTETGACLWGSETETKYGYSPSVTWWFYRLPTSVAETWKATYVSPYTVST